MFLALLQVAPTVPAPSSVEQDAFQTILDGAASGNIVLAIVGGVVLIGLVILGILKKDHPIIKPIAEMILSFGKKMANRPKAADQPGLGVVVPIKNLEDSPTDPDKK